MYEDQSIFLWSPQLLAYSINPTVGTESWEIYKHLYIQPSRRRQLCLFTASFSLISVVNCHDCFSERSQSTFPRSFPQIWIQRWPYPWPILLPSLKSQACFSILLIASEWRIHTFSKSINEKWTQQSRSEFELGMRIYFLCHSYVTRTSNNNVQVLYLLKLLSGLDTLRKPLWHLYKKIWFNRVYSQ